MSTATDEFLDLYKELEQALKLRAEESPEHYENSVARFQYSEEGAPYRDTLNACREIRNLLQHLPKVGGTYPITPSPEIIAELKRITQTVEHPQPAMDCAVQKDKIFKADIDARLKKILSVMHERGFSQVPVMDGKQMAGILSVQCVFCYVSENHQITDETRIRDLSEYIHPDKHRNEYYRFAPKDISFFEVDKMFEQRDAKHRRLAAIFLTEHGKFGEYPLGMLTPWSVLSQKK